MQRREIAGTKSRPVDFCKTSRCPLYLDASKKNTTLSLQVHVRERSSLETIYSDLCAVLRFVCLFLSLWLRASDL